MKAVNRYVLRASATPQDVGIFMMSYFEGDPQPLSLEFAGLKRSRCKGVIDERGLRFNPDADVSITFKPDRDCRVPSDGNHNLRRTELSKWLLIWGGKLLIKGELALLATDPFAQKVEKGFSTELEQGLLLEQTGAIVGTRRQPPFVFLDKVFETPIFKS